MTVAEAGNALRVAHGNVGADRARGCVEEDQPGPGKRPAVMAPLKAVPEDNRDQRAARDRAEANRPSAARGAVRTCSYRERTERFVVSQDGLLSSRSPGPGASPS